MHLKYFNDRFSGTLELVLINKGRGIVVVLKSGNADGAKDSSRVMKLDGKPYAGKLARTVWAGGKSGDNIKGLPISIYN